MLNNKLKFEFNLWKIHKKKLTNVMKCFMLYSYFSAV